ncbi:hypothetical protein [Streptomyces lutosisoli]|uniref:Uncharacterized protein n=1 Tax=Streptomyces lutosisoli TaxID=2665721 RepID=A0ABW2VTT9_9ACTN
MSELTPGGQAVYLSELPTGSLVTPADAQGIRAAAVASLGWEGLRRAHLIAALRNSALMPDGHCDRHEWADSAARWVDPHGHF